MIGHPRSRRQPIEASREADTKYNEASGRKSMTELAPNLIFPSSGPIKTSHTSFPTCGLP